MLRVEEKVKTLQYVILEKVKNQKKKETRTFERDHQQLESFKKMLLVNKGMCFCPVQLASISPNFSGADGMQGGYGRFATIYSYSLSDGVNRVNSFIQGPHTLAHVSVNYLMDHPLESVDRMKLYRKQIIHPQKVESILKEFNIDITKGKAEKYFKSYSRKYEEFQQFCDNPDAIFSKPNALLRELMEMHPMAVYGWKQNLCGENMVRRASKRSIQGKGEQYGAEIRLDRGWQPRGVLKRQMKKMPEWKNMREYLRLRLSIAIIEECLDNAVDQLMEYGKYTISDRDRGNKDLQASLPRAGDARNISTGFL